MAKLELDQVALLDFKEIIPNLCLQLKTKRNGKLLSILNSIKIDGHKFKFVYNENSFYKIYVKCPKCKEPKLKLYKLDDVYWCSSCHRVVKKKNKRRSTVYSKYVRPLKLLKEIEDALFTDNITEGKRRKLEIKAEKLRKIIPIYIYELREKVLKSIQKDKDIGLSDK
jgi:ribosomal protein L37AE/L43A